MLLMKESVSLNEKPTHWFSYFQIDCKYYKSVKTDLLHILFLMILVYDY